MYRDICLTNSEAITRWLDTYIANLGQLRQRIAARDRNLNESFVNTQQTRQQWQASQETTKDGR